MIRNYYSLSKQAPLYLLIGLTVLPAGLLAAPRMGGVQPQTSAREERREQMKEEVMKEFSALSDALKTILTLTSQNQRPEPAQIQEAADLLEQNKRNAALLEENEKAEFMLLQAWVGFYQKNPVEAVNWSMRACKTDENNRDAWISQALFCLLNEKRPMEQRVSRSREDRADRQGNGEARRGRNARSGMENTNPGQLYGQQGVLDFDMSLLRTDVLRQEFVSMKMTTVDGSTIEYKTGQDTLCILLWEDPEAERPENQPKNAEETRDPDGMMMNPGMPAGPQGRNTLEQQRQYLNTIKKACEAEETIKFVQIDTTTPRNLQEYLDNLPDYAGSEFPTVISAMPRSQAELFLGTRAENPFMVIVNPEGRIQYSGPAADFMPAFILTEMTGIPIELGNQPSHQQMISPDRPVLLDDIFLRPEVPVIKTDPNAPPQDPNSLKTKVNRPAHPTTQQPPQKTYKQLPMEEDIQAQKEITYVRDLFTKAASKGAISYKTAVDMSREIIRKYPGTTYEEQARMELRKVPDDKKKLYGITPEETGL